MMPSRRVQLVSTKSERKAVIQWMVAQVEENGSDCKIAAQVVDQFPSIFIQTNRRANRENSRRWWKTINDFLSAIETSHNKSLSISSCHKLGCAVRRKQIKALRGRGPKRHWWKNILHEILGDEFSRLCRN